MTFKERLKALKERFKQPRYFVPTLIVGTALVTLLVTHLLKEEAPVVVVAPAAAVAPTSTPVVVVAPAAAVAPTSTPVVVVAPAVEPQDQIKKLQQELADLRAGKAEEVRTRVTTKYATIESVHDTSEVLTAHWAKHPRVLDHIELPFHNKDGTGLIVETKGEDDKVYPPELTNWGDDEYEPILLTVDHIKEGKNPKTGESMRKTVANGNVYGRIKKEAK